MSSSSSSTPTYTHSAVSASVALKTFDGKDFILYEASVTNYFTAHNIHHVLTTDPGTPSSRLSIGGVSANRKYNNDNDDDDVVDDENNDGEEEEEEQMKDERPFIHPPDDESKETDQIISERAKKNKRIQDINDIIVKDNARILRKYQQKQNDDQKHIKKSSIIETVRRLCFSYVFTSLSSDVARLFLHIPAGNIYALWSAIKLKYKGVTLVNQGHIRDMMNTVFLGPGEDIDTYVSKINGYQLQLEELDAGMSSYDLIYRLYKGLPESYDVVVKMIKHSSRGIILTFDEIVTSLREYQIEERNKVIVAQAHLAQERAYAVTNTNTHTPNTHKHTPTSNTNTHTKPPRHFTTKICFRCASLDHISPKCPISKEAVVCDTCKMKGHMTSQHTLFTTYTKATNIQKPHKFIKAYLIYEKEEKAFIAAREERALFACTAHSFFVSESLGSIGGAPMEKVGEQQVATDGIISVGGTPMQKAGEQQVATDGIISVGGAPMKKAGEQQVTTDRSDMVNGNTYANTNGTAHLAQATTGTNGFAGTAGIQVATGVGRKLYHLDSGATSHFTNDASTLSSVGMVQQINLHTAGGNTLTANQSGLNTIRNADGNGVSVTFKDTVYVPNLSAKLISVGQLAANGNIIVFDGKQATVIKPDGRSKLVLPSGTSVVFPKVGKLYTMEDVSQLGMVDGVQVATGSGMVVEEKVEEKVGEQQVATDGIISVGGAPMKKAGEQQVTTGGILTKTQLLHAQLGHLSGTGMQKLLKCGSVDGMDMVVNGGIKLDEIKNCIGCLQGKATRQSFDGVRTSKVGGILDCIHSDVCTVNGKYFITFIDEYSRMVWINVIDYKSECEQCIKEWIILQETQAGKKVKEFHSDNGGEYVSKTLLHWFKSKGIYATTTVARTPERNGIAECMNRVLLNKARPSLIAAGMSGSYWVYAIHSSVYIRNRCTTKGIDSVNGGNGVPMVVWSGGIKPTIKHIKVFGCNVFVHVDDALRDGKLDVRAKKGVHLGWDETKNGYYVYDILSKKVTTQHSVVFVENDFSHVVLMEQDIIGNKIDVTSIVYPDIYGGDIGTYDDNELELVKRISLDVVSNGVRFEEKLGEQQVATDGIISVGGAPMQKAGEQQVATDGIISVGGAPMKKAGEQQVTTGGVPKVGKGIIDIDNVVVGKRNRKVNIKYGMVSDGDIGHLLLEDECSLLVGDDDVNSDNDDGDLESVATDTPDNYNDAMKSVDSAKWKAAMDVEMNALRANNTFKLVELPADTRALPVRWVYAIKHKSDGSIDKYKARLVVRGDQQRPGIDYDPNNIYAPVVGIATLRILLSIATILSLELLQMDVKTAFLNAIIDRKVYIKQAQGYDDFSLMVYLLLKTLYGLRQASYLWNALINAFMLEHGWVACIIDPCLYIKISHLGNLLLFSVFVDDCFGAIDSLDMDEYNLFKALFMKRFDTTDLGIAEWLLKIKIVRDRTARTLFMSQKLYIQNMVKTYGLTEAKAVSTPQANDIKLSKCLCPVVGSPEHTSLIGNNYREMVGSLLYATITRMDIAHIVNILSRFLNNPGYLHIQAAIHVIKYLKCTDEYGLLYTGYESDGITVKKLQLTAYSDADWAGNIDDYKSTSGGLIYLGGNLVDGFTRSQHTVSLSSTESEYIAAVETLKSVKFCRTLLSELSIKQSLPITLFCDNKSTITLTLNKGIVSNMRHMHIRYHWIKNDCINGIFKLIHIGSKDQLADILTKTLSPKPFKSLRDHIVSKFIQS